jgi:hypothetical protein
MMMKSFVFAPWMVILNLLSLLFMYSVLPSASSSISLVTKQWITNFQAHQINYFRCLVINARVIGFNKFLDFYCTWQFFQCTWHYNFRTIVFVHPKNSVYFLREWKLTEIILYKFVWSSCNFVWEYLKRWVTQKFVSSTYNFFNIVLL